MRLAMIAAMDRNRLIGNNNRLPWHLPADFAHFRQLTLGKPVIMGRKTYESIGKPLPGRRNIVLSRAAEACRQKPMYEGVDCVENIEAALALAADAEEVMIIGGGSLYESLLPRARRLYLTEVDAEFEGDAWFPPIDPAEWREIESHWREADDKNPCACRFVTLERVE